MSYILDALRRADAERERGAVPSLHAQQQFALGEGDGESEGRPKLVWWIVSGLAAVLIAVIAWIWLGGAAQTAAIAPAPAPPVVVTPPATPATPQSPDTAPPIAAVTPAPQAAPVAAPPQAQSQRPTTRRTARVPKAAEDDDRSPADDRTTRRAAPRTEARSSGRNESPTSEPTVAGNATRRAAPNAQPGAPREASRERDPAPESRRVAEAPQTAATVGAADGRIVPQRELPEDVRRSLPNFKVGGSAYSSDPSSRMLMINGQIFREGDAVAAGLVLRQIRPKGAVFEFKGYRYEMAF